MLTTMKRLLLSLAGLLAAAALFALGLYAYGTAFLFPPLFLLGACILLLRGKWIRPRDALLCAGIYFLLSFPIYGTMLAGADIYQQTLTDKGIIVMGNEGNGISPEVRQLVTDKLLIPNFNKNHETAESLNVAIATAITLSEFRRRITQ